MDALRRTARTFLQAFLGTLIGSGVLSATVDSGVVNGDALKKVAVSGAAAGFVAAFALLQNLLEDNSPLPALLKPAPEPVIQHVYHDAPAAPVKKAAKKVRAKKAAP